MNEVINYCVTGLNHGGKVFCDYAAGVLLQSAILVIVLLVADLLLRKRVRAVFRYGVWLLVVVKLILPPTLALPTGIGYWLGDRLPAPLSGLDRPAQAIGLDRAGRPPSPGSPLSRETTQVESFPSASQADAPIASAASGLSPLTWPGILFLLWLGGVLAFGALLVQRLRFVKGLTAFSLPADGRFQDAVAECGRQVGIRREVELRVSETMSSPALCGLRRPVILVPARILETLTPEGLRAILIHELAHLKRGDVWVNTLQTVLQVLHFYNPFVWLANAMIRRTREEAVDETVLVALGGQAEDYSNTLINIGEMALWKADLGLRLIGVAESEKILRWRIKHMLTRPVPKSARIGMLNAVVLVITAALLLPMAKAEKSNQAVSVPRQAASAEASVKAPVAAESYVFVDANTGIELHKVTTISGPSDIIEYNTGLNMSPNGKFLLWGVKVVPLDGGKPFDLVDMPHAGRGSWSPNGRLVTFYAGAIWLLPVDPETGRSAGPPEKLLEGNYLFQGPVHWSPDSESITFSRYDKEVRGELWTLSLKDKSLAKVTDLSRTGKQSPDGRYTAYSNNTGFWVKPVAGGEAKKIGEATRRFLREHPILWSADGAWVLFTGDAEYSPTELRFFRLADGREVKLRLPARMGGCIGVSPDQKKVFLYRHSYEEREALRVVSVSGGPSFELGRQMSYVDPYSQFWSPDSATVIAGGEWKGDDWNLWALALSGGTPVALKTDVSVPGKIWQRQLSPDCKHLLLSIGADTKTQDLWAAPVSWQEMRTTGPARLVFKNWNFMPSGGSVTPGIWSPDGTRIAVMQTGPEQGEIWIASLEGGEPVQLTGGPGRKGWPLWSPDGQSIAFYSAYSPTDVVIQVVSASGGEAKTVQRLTSPPDARGGSKAWSPDGKALTIADGGMISSVSISGSSSEPLVKLAEIGKDAASGVRWSPDGQSLAFVARKTGEPHQLFLLRRQDGHVTKILDEEDAYFFWSPDSKWISYSIEQNIKTRPEGVLWEMDVEEAMAKLAK